MAATGFRFVSAKPLVGGSVNLYASKDHTYVTVYNKRGVVMREQSRVFPSVAKGKVYLNNLKAVQ